MLTTLEDPLSGCLLQAPEAFSLADTLLCGQCFRWHEDPQGYWQGIVQGQRVTVTQPQPDLLCLHGPDAERQADQMAAYFDLSRSYTAIRTVLSRSPGLRRAAESAPGIRILRQEPFEALLSFIISQNNNIPRISGIVERLCEAFGDPLPGGGHAFPTPKQLEGVTVQDLAPLRAGFRAGYLCDAVARVCDGRLPLDAPYTLPLDAARELLMQVRGVGPKVADCVLLFGYSRLESFPVDVWVHRAMQRLYPRGLPRYARPYAGIAQQYLFYYARRDPDGLF